MREPSKLYLIDGSAIAYRSYFGMMRNRLSTSKGFATGATFAFVNALRKIINDEKPDLIGMAFDAPEKTFRHRIYPEYKATREAMPEDLVAQLPWIFKITRAMNIPLIIQPGYEADDIIGTLAMEGKNRGILVYMVTGDKDFMQLVGDGIKIYKPHSSRSDVEIIDVQDVVNKFGIQPKQVADYLALVGDSSDNIPGIKGVGPAKATPLLQEWGSLENILNHVDEIPSERIASMIRDGAENARFSRLLATIKIDVPLETELDELRFSGVNESELMKIYEELEFVSLIKTDTKDDLVDKLEKNYRTIHTLDEVQSLVKSLKNVQLISVDLETTSVSPMLAEIVGIALSWKPHQGVYVPIQSPSAQASLFSGGSNFTFLNELKPLLENPNIRKCGQNLKYDMLILRRNGIELAGVDFDTMIAAFLIQPDSRSYKLDKLSQYYLGYTMQPIEELIGSGKNQITMDQVDVEKVGWYASEDADIALELVPVFTEKLKSDRTWDVFKKIEMPLIPVLIQLEQNGVFLDVKFLRKMSISLEKDIDDLVSRIYSAAGREFNVNSPKQLGEILFDKLELPKVRGHSTDVSVLEKLQNKHSLPKLVLDYRGLMKLKGTYLDALPVLVNPKTGRVHSSFNQTVASTGRLSSSDPNFQNIPIRTDLGREIRKAFIPQKKGWKLLSADYSQIELRIMAHLSRDAELICAFQEDVDVHRRTAALVYGVPEKDVLPEMRRVAKIVNFGIMYGAGPYRMTDELGISMSEARKLIDQYFKTYPGINDYIIKTTESARKTGYVKTLSGRLRYVPDIDSLNKNVRDAAERVAINMPIQGTAADMIKLAMIRIHDELKSRHLRAMMILQIHDELLLEVPNDEIETVKTIVTDAMESALPLDIPVKAEVGIGNSWYEAH
ncbi:MAG: DNA polymerase I [Candidatus Marinimicrobia bacterium CG08_land_8_20_14_0_20_45_22]|nr:MAG: DNA polymerase I [Candidatus Marinimicrobia bacterium CG08_land_8_20_14_0_20_45_22]